MEFLFDVLRTWAVLTLLVVLDGIVERSRTRTHIHIHSAGN